MDLTEAVDIKKRWQEFTEEQYKKKKKKKKGNGTMDWFQIGKGVFKADYCHLAYLSYMQSTSCKMLDWMKHKLESRVSGEISITSDTQMTPPLWQKVKRNSKAS